MLQEAMKPIALVLCLLSLCAVFYTAFLLPASGLEQRIWDSTTLLSLAAGICLTSGMIFREPTRDGVEPILRTLPVQVFCWATAMVVALFAASWWLETYCVFYKDVRWF
jgi:cation transport ATPase